MDQILGLWTKKNMLRKACDNTKQFQTMVLSLGILIVAFIFVGQRDVCGWLLGWWRWLFGWWLAGRQVGEQLTVVMVCSTIRTADLRVSARNIIARQLLVASSSVPFSDLVD